MNDRKTHDPLRVNARNLRKSMTPQERRLWYDFLKNLPQTVYRQKIIGNFIVDFYISSCKLVIELDGAQHTEPQAVEYDAQRTAYLQGIGCRVLRYANNAVDTNFAGVCEDILHTVLEVWEQLLLCRNQWSQILRRERICGLRQMSVHHKQGMYFCLLLQSQVSALLLRSADHFLRLHRLYLNLCRILRFFSEAVDM